MLPTHTIITGCGCVGKSTLVALLTGKLNESDVVDFDAPDFASDLFPDGQLPGGAKSEAWGADWRRQATKAWAKRIVQAKRSVVLIGHIVPDEFNPGAGGGNPIQWGMLTARPETLQRRWALREGWSLDVGEIAEWQDHLLRQVSRQPRFKVFTTEERTPTEVAGKLLEWLLALGDGEE